MFSKAILVLSIATAALAKVPEAKVASAGKFQNLFLNLKKAEKSNNIASIVSTLAHKSLANNQLESEVDEFFRYVDANQDGYVSPQEFDNFYTSQGFAFSDEEIAYIYLLVDSNGDGLISW